MAVQATTRLRRVSEPEEGMDVEALAAEQPPTAQPSASETQRKIISAALQMALRTLSQKTVIALASLYSLLLAGAVFWVFWRILADPTVLQLVGASTFALFVIVLHLVRKR